MTVQSHLLVLLKKWKKQTLLVIYTKFKNLQEDQFFNFVQSRVPSGMHEVTIEQLKMLKDLPKEEFT